MWEYVISFGAILFAGIGVLIAFLTLQEKKKQARIFEYRKQQQEREEKEKLKLDRLLTELKEEINCSFKDEMMEVIEEHILVDHEGLITTDQSKYEHNRIWKQLQNIEEKLDQHFTQSTESEVNKLAHDIANYADELRVNIPKSRASYKNIAHCYDRYKRLGGNHFIDGEFAYIKKRMEEMDNE